MSKDKKVLVTGSSGFLGSHIVDALFDEGYEVILFDAIESKFKKSGQKEFNQRGYKTPQRNDSK